MISVAKLVPPRHRPARAVNECRLLDRARAAYPELHYAALTHDVLAELSAREGVDFATALFFDRIRRSPEHGPFVRAIEAIEPDLSALPRVPGTLLVAPAAFYREYPEFGGDGLIVRQIAGEFGMETRVADVPSVGSVTQAADALAAALRGCGDGTVVLASLSKGGADVRVALEKHPELATKVRAWIQVAGLVHGSPAASGLLNSPWWRRGLVSGYLACTRAHPQFVRELQRGPGGLLAGRAVAPPGMTVINVVGFPLACHLSGSARKRHARMALLGPNDGSTLLRDAIVDGGAVYPVWGADHFMRVPEISRLLYRLFVHLAGAA